jgi:hypothetical protein
LEPLDEETEFLGEQYANVDEDLGIDMTPEDFYHVNKAQTKTKPPRTTKASSAGTTSTAASQPIKLPRNIWDAICEKAPSVEQMILEYNRNLRLAAKSTPR